MTKTKLKPKTEMRLIDHDYYTLRHNLLNRKMEIFDIKQFMELETFFRLKLKQILKDYRQWQRAYADETDAMQILYGQLEGIMLRRQVQCTIRAYWIVRKDARQAANGYLSQLHPQY